MVKKYCRRLFRHEKRRSTFRERTKVFCNLLKYLINTGNKFSYGIDEVFLKLF